MQNNWRKRNDQIKIKKKNKVNLKGIAAKKLPRMTSNNIIAGSV